MPFAPGSSREAIRTNIGAFRHAGYSKEQASAAAFDMAARAKARARKKKCGSKKKSKKSLKSAKRGATKVVRANLVRTSDVMRRKRG